MKIVYADKLGFCFGVNEALTKIDTVIEKEKGKNIFMLGMIVHNKTVIDDLLEKGIKIINNNNNIENLNSNDIVIIRAHGVSKEIYKLLDEKRVKYYDATCIFVKRSREILVKKEKEGYQIIFIGDRDHPEVKGIVSFGKNVIIYKDFEDMKNNIKELNKKYFIIAQTTLNKNMYLDIIEYRKKYLLNSEIADTVCGATYERQKAVEKLAKIVDIVIIVGGHNSSNTKKLYNVSKNINKSSYHIERIEEIKKEWFENCETVGITAGASTPEKVIKQVEKYIKEAI
ncbi:4-hydroxy-3-methylbut-2-enyl diphosphate reductase [Haliovirga abyssi]|uniref:4-hydroxy-3-methylbut-2-enyl diphosphate reductase n=1 Tax=Haliovirga abyssi TaxID=2996794 RepID=A0AAU9DX35_9FUSO|nr:4-hydroxy-3-methylbut-2-enyl diphosphate reductase [Haliovirga abyssi]BDU49880.1 hypothetical protein HLVA_04490 [Haliovirga abyssi]